MECHFHDFVTKVVIYILPTDSLHSLLGLHALGEAYNCVRRATVGLATEGLNPIGHQNLNPTHN